MASKIVAILPFAGNFLIRPLATISNCPVSLYSASPRHNHDLSLRSLGQEFIFVGRVSGGRWGSIAVIPPGPFCPLTPFESGISAISVFFANLGNFPYAGVLMSPASSPMSPRRAGSVTWVPRRPPYAILTNAYGNRRPTDLRQLNHASSGRRKSFLSLLPPS